MCKGCDLSRVVIDLQLQQTDNRKLLEIRLQEFDLVASQRTSIKELEKECKSLFVKDLTLRQKIGLRQAEIIAFVKSDMYKPHEGSPTLH